MSIVIRLENVISSVKTADIRDFFQGLKIRDGGVVVVGGVQGLAFVLFVSDEDASVAMRKDGQKLLGTAIRILLSSKNELQRTIADAKEAARKRKVASIAARANRALMQEQAASSLAAPPVQNLHHRHPGREEEYVSSSHTRQPSSSASRMSPSSEDHWQQQTKEDRRKRRDDRKRSSGEYSREFSSSNNGAREGARSQDTYTNTRGHSSTNHNPSLIGHDHRHSEDYGHSLHSRHQSADQAYMDRRSRNEPSYNSPPTRNDSRRDRSPHSYESSAAESRHLHSRQQSSEREYLDSQLQHAHDAIDRYAKFDPFDPQQHGSSYRGPALSPEYANARDAIDRYAKFDPFDPQQNSRHLSPYQHHADTISENTSRHGDQPEHHKRRKYDHPDTLIDSQVKRPHNVAPREDEQGFSQSSEQSEFYEQMREKKPSNVGNQAYDPHMVYDNHSTENVPINSTQVQVPQLEQNLPIRHEVVVNMDKKDNETYKDVFLCIGNLHDSVGEPNIRKLFSMYKLPEDGVRIMKASSSRERSAFVRFNDESDAEGAQRLDGWMMKGSRIRVAKCSAGEFYVARETYEEYSSLLEGKCVIVSNLDPTVSDRDLNVFFANMPLSGSGGPFFEVDVNGRSTGKAMIQFLRREDFLNCFQYQNHTLLGSPVRIEAILEKHIKVCAGTVDSEVAPNRDGQLSHSDPSHNAENNQAVPYQGPHSAQATHVPPNTYNWTNTWPNYNHPPPPYMAMRQKPPMNMAPSMSSGKQRKSSLVTLVGDGAREPEKKTEVSVFEMMIRKQHETIQEKKLKNPPKPFSKVVAVKPTEPPSSVQIQAKGFIPGKKKIQLKLKNEPDSLKKSTTDTSVTETKEDGVDKKDQVGASQELKTDIKADDEVVMKEENTSPTGNVIATVGSKDVVLPLSGKERVNFYKLKQSGMAKECMCKPCNMLFSSHSSFKVHNIQIHDGKLTANFSAAAISNYKKLN